MPFCSNCGSDIGQEERFCSNCGQLAGGGESSKKSKKSKIPKAKKRTIIIIVGLLLALSIFGGTVFSQLLFGDDEYNHSMIIDFLDDSMPFKPLEIERGMVEDPKKGYKFVAGEVLIIPNNGVSQQEVENIVESLTDGAVVGGSTEIGLFQVEIPGDKAIDVLEAVSALKTSSLFEDVFPNYEIVTPGEIVPSVPQWTDRDEKKRWGQVCLELQKAWAISTGDATLKIGLLDHGFDFSHPDLTGRMTWLRPPYEVVDIRHGTIMASIVGANALNNEGMAGVIWEAQFYGCSGLNNLRNFQIAVHGMIRERVKVILWVGSVPWSIGGDYDEEVFEIVKSGFEPLIRLARLMDVLIVVPAGNNPSVPGEKILPAAFAEQYDNVINVGAINSNMERAALSTYGEVVSVAAPGQDVWAATVPTEWWHSKKKYGYFQGTCASAAFVAGVAGLIRSVNPDLKAAQVKDIIVNTAVPHDFDQPLGSGVVNAFRALEEARRLKDESLDETEEIETEPDDVSVEEQLQKHPLVNLLGTTVGDIYKEYGKPRNADWLTGGFLHSYFEKEKFGLFSFYPEESEPIIEIWYRGDDEILGVRRGMTFAEIKTTLGKPYLDSLDIPRYVYVDTAVLRLRSGPSTDHETLDRLVIDTELRVIGSKDEWLEVVTPEGKKGWVHGDYVFDDQEYASEWGSAGYSIHYLFENVIEIDVDGERLDLLLLTFEGDSLTSTTVSEIRIRAANNKYRLPW